MPTIKINGLSDGQREDLIRNLKIKSSSIEDNRYPMSVQKDTSIDELKKSIEVLTERIEALENLLKRTLDGHILINGSWAKLTNVSSPGLIL